MHGDKKRLKMGQHARLIVDAQVGIHKNLQIVVDKHFKKTYQKPIAEHTQIAFDTVKPAIEKALKAGFPLIFDSCCGTAMSTVIIANKNPSALVIGIDRSAVRLSKIYNNNLPNNVLLVQAECADFWLLAQSEGWRLAKHSIFYPNPYPKSKHLKRRWHGHPAFPTLLALGGVIELRTNWKVYADEFCYAINSSPLDDLVCSGVNVLKIIEPLTLFEKKYQESAQTLYHCKVGYNK